MCKKYSQFFLCFVSALVFVAPATGQQEEVLTILHEPGTHQGYRTWLNWSGGPLKLIHHLNSHSIEAIDRREAEVANLKTADDWRQRQARVRDYLDTLVGPWPDRTPLNAMIKPPPLRLRR